MKKIIIALLILMVSANLGYSQGCVAIRNIAGGGQFAELGYGQSTDKWMMDINNRYFYAWRFLQGKADISPTSHSDDIRIYEYTMNIGISRVLDKGWSLALDLPVVVNTASSKLEHASGDRHA